MTGRATILGRIRAQLDAAGSDEARRAAVVARLRERPTGVIPARGQLPGEERVALFVAMAEKYAATSERVETLEALPAAVSRYLASRNLPAAIRMGDDARLAAAPWQSEPLIEIRHGASDGKDLAGVSHAYGAIAESGTLALLSGADNPVTVTFLPEHHIVAVEASDVAGDLESLFGRLRAERAAQAMPRTVNFVTGPSRSADIEQTLLLGAHGPRALHIVVVGRA